MLRKKIENNENAKSTVLNMRDEFDWGRILFDACYMFNYSLAEHWLNYVCNYNYDKECINVNNEIKDMICARESILTQRKILKENSRNSSQSANIFYKKYIKALPIGNFVKDYRKNSGNANEFKELIKTRKDAYNNYHLFVDENISATNRENEFIRDHLFQTRNLSAKVRTLKKIVNTHELELANSIEEDLEVLYNLLISEEQAERLMGVCINILNTYSGKEFSTTLSLQDREKIADNIYNYFSTFEHNYDFITGCYQKGEDNKLYIKDVEQLKNKLYNGYYFTIRGFVQRSYVAARDEKYNIESVDAYWNDENEHSSNKGFDKYVGVADCTEDDDNNVREGYSVLASSNSEFGEGMINFWQLCHQYLLNNVDCMANELLEKMKESFPKMNYYSSMINNHIMVNLIINTLSGINEELKRGRNVSSKLKHIILDSMNGAESKKEWKYCVDFTSDIIMKYINKFFIYNNAELYEKEL